MQMQNGRKKRCGRWKPSEVAVLQEHYLSKGASWLGWEQLLPGRSCDAIWSKANKLGLKYEPHTPKNVVLVQMDANTCGECAYYRENVGGRGRCAERHAVGLFGKAPEVFAHYDTSICKHRKGKLVRVERDDAG